MEKGVNALSKKMKGREAWLIIILTFLFTLGGSSYGMGRKPLYFILAYSIFLAAGYDLLVPVAVIFAVPKWEPSLLFPILSLLLLHLMLRG